MSLFWKKHKAALVKQPVIKTQDKVNQTVTKQQTKPILKQSKTVSLYKNWPKHVKKVYSTGQEVVE